MCERFGFGKGKYLLAEECAKRDTKFLVAKKVAVTRWVAHKEKSYENHFKTILSQVKVLKKSKVGKRIALANEMLNVVNVALILVAKTILKQLRQLSEYGQSRNKASWMYPKMAKEVLQKLKKLRKELVESDEIQLKFESFPLMISSILEETRL